MLYEYVKPLFVVVLMKQQSMPFGKEVFINVSLGFGLGGSRSHGGVVVVVVVNALGLLLLFENEFVSVEEMSLSFWLS